MTQLLKCKRRDAFRLSVRHNDSEDNFNPNLILKHRLMTTIAQRLTLVRDRINTAAHASTRRIDQIQLVAVSKTQPVAAIAEAIAAGQMAFGENYLQEALPKITALVAHPLQWHFIGPIQRNKTADIAANFAWVHSVDRLSIAQRLNDQRPAGLSPLNICIQVNISQEDSKAGVAPTEVLTMAQTLSHLPRLRLRGLMTIPKPSADPVQQRTPLRQLRQLLEDINAQGLALDTLSMGMSDDLEAAIGEGATIIRVGTAIFGQRA